MDIGFIGPSYREFFSDHLKSEDFLFFEKKKRFGQILEILQGVLTIVLANLYKELEPFCK